MQTFVYGSNELESDKTYQVNQAKIAIAKGGLLGVGPGNSEQRNFLPHSYSDFIYAIIIEEYGLFGPAYYGPYRDTFHPVYPVSSRSM